MTAFAMVGSTGEAYRVGVGTYGKIASASALIHSACFFFIGLRLWALGKRHGYMTQIEFFRDRFESRALGYLLFPVLVGLLIPYLLVGLMGAGSVVKGVTPGAFPEIFPGTSGAVPPALTSAVVAAVVLSYIFFSGVRGAAWANTFQTLVFMAMGLVAFCLISHGLGGPAAASRMADPGAAVRAGNITELQFLSYMLVPLSVGMFPHIFQNCLTARSAKTFRLMLVAHPICIMLTWIPCILFGFWATGATLPGAGEPLIREGTNPNAVLGIMVGQFATPLVGGLVTAGVLAAIMSSLDSQFVSVGTMFTRDIVIPLVGRGRLNDGQILWLARGFIVAIVLVTYLLTLVEPRQIFALARANYLPHWFAEVHPRFKTPHRAILAGGVVGIAAIYSDQLIQFGGQTLTANIVTMSVFGAIVMYITSMLSLFKLRKSEPGMERPFKAPFYPWFPLFALLGALICLGTMVYYNLAVAGVFFGMLALGYIVFIAVKRERETAPLDEMLESAEEMQLEQIGRASCRERV